MAVFMKKTVPFVLMLFIAMGSVVVSCATSARVRTGESGREVPLSINTGKTTQGDIHTIQVFSHIDKVIVVDRTDRSRKTELAKEDWSYDPATTKITIARDFGYKDIIVHVEGSAALPATFVLPDVQGEDLFVVLGKRLALEGFDYRFDHSSGILVFRDDIDPEKETYMIQYETSMGSSCLGNMMPDSKDELAYLEAQHRKELLKRWYKSQDGFYFFETPVIKGEKPKLVKRSEEMRKMLNIPVAVMKTRLKVSDEKISKEVGFDVRTPKEIRLAGQGGKLESWGKTIEETSTDGKLNYKVSEMYHREGIMNSADPNGDMMLSMSAEEFPGWDPEDPNLLVADSLLDLGTNVRKRIVWGTRGGLYGEPDVVLLAVYAWQCKEVFFDLVVDEGMATDAEHMIREIIAFRGK